MYIVVVEHTHTASFSYNVGLNYADDGNDTDDDNVNIALNLVFHYTSYLIQTHTP